MTRLHTELLRLYAPHAGATPQPPDAPALVDAQGQVRALVLELAGPQVWPLLLPLCQALRDEAELPAPAIAVNGRDALQLWLSLATPVPAARAADWAARLARRHLAAARPQALRLFPAPDASQPGAWQHAPLPPQPQAEPGRWSAFIAPDLAPVMAEEPWIDLPPGADGQAALLSGLRSLAPQRLAQWLGDAEPAAGEAPAQAANGGAAAQGAVAASAGAPAATAPASAPAAFPHDDPRAFLRAVMNDPGTPLPLRIEAAKALLAAPLPHDAAGR